jgi:hypothetical protein
MEKQGNERPEYTSKHKHNLSEIRYPNGDKYAKESDKRHREGDIQSSETDRKKTKLEKKDSRLVQTPFKLCEERPSNNKKKSFQGKIGQKIEFKSSFKHPNADLNQKTKSSKHLAKESKEMKGSEVYLLKVQKIINGIRAKNKHKSSVRLKSLDGIVGEIKKNNETFEGFQLNGSFLEKLSSLRMELTDLAAQLNNQVFAIKQRAYTDTVEITSFYDNILSTIEGLKSYHLEAIGQSNSRVCKISDERIKNTAHNLEMIDGLLQIFDKDLNITFHDANILTDILKQIEMPHIDLNYTTMATAPVKFSMEGIARDLKAMIQLNPSNVFHQEFGKFNQNVEALYCCLDDMIRRNHQRAKDMMTAQKTQQNEKIWDLGATKSRTKESRSIGGFEEGKPIRFHYEHKGGFSSGSKLHRGTYIDLMANDNEYIAPKVLEFSPPAREGSTAKKRKAVMRMSVSREELPTEELMCEERLEKPSIFKTLPESLY